MFQNVAFAMAFLCLTTTVYAEQICYEGEPPQLDVSCEYAGGGAYLHIEVLDIFKPVLTRRAIFLGNSGFGSDEGRANCEKQLQIFKSSPIASVVRKPTLVAACNETNKLVRLIVSPQSPYINVIDEKATESLSDCLTKMESINKQN